MRRRELIEKVQKLEADVALADLASREAKDAVTTLRRQLQRLYEPGVKVDYRYTRSPWGLFACGGYEVKNLIDGDPVATFIERHDLDAFLATLTCPIDDRTQDRPKQGEESK